MGKDGSCLSRHQTRIWTTSRRQHDTTSPGLPAAGSSKRPHRASAAAPPIHSTPLWLLAVVGATLCLIHSAVATSTPCPEQCQCSNLTAASSTSVFSVDCSHGGVHSFYAWAAEGQYDPGLSAAKGNDSETAVTTDGNQNITSISALLGSNGTRQGLGLQEVEVPPHPKSHMTGPLVQAVVDLDLSFNNVSAHELQYLFNRKVGPLVRTLNLSHNQIQAVDSNSSLRFLVNLVSLDLSSNNIASLSPQVFQHFNSLQYVYLSGNKLSNIDSQPPSHVLPPTLPSLLSMDLSYNYLTEISAQAFSAFPMLVSLNLSHNNITKISHFAFQALTKLQMLSLSHNNIVCLDYPVFQNTSLFHLSLACLPNLTSLNHNVFRGLRQLQHLNISHSAHLDFLNPVVFSELESLEVLDLSASGIRQLSPITFQNNLKLQSVYLRDIPLTCQCTNAWLVDQIRANHSIYQDVSSLQCQNLQDNNTLPLADAVFPCEQVVLQNMTTDLSISVGSMLMLRCKQASSSTEEIYSWTTPRGRVFRSHPFHPNASQHLLSDEDVKLDSPFHLHHPWHQSSSYYSELDSYEDRILILSDGSLFIDYVLRTDAGEYTCTVKNAYYNSSGTTNVKLRYTISGEIKIIACIVGILCAIGFFTLNLLYVIISWLARRLINKRRREHIGQMLENLNNYKSTQITRIYENYTYQLNRVRNRYHSQRDRLHRNYTMQVERVKRGCSHQVEKVRDNYHSRLNQLREYSSSQIVQIRDIANTQIGRIRDYGSLQLDRLRETYKLQQQHVLKLLDTMNLDNCRSIVETECMRTESMMYDLDLLSQEDERTESPFSMGESEYNTAASSPVRSLGPKEPQHGRENMFHQGDTTDTESDRNEYLAENDNRGLAETAYEHAQTDNKDISPKSSGQVCDIDNETQSTGDDIEIEMECSLPLANNVQLDAKEVWTHQKRDETLTLYTKIHPQDGSDSICQTNGPENRLHVEASNLAASGEGETSKAAVPLPSMDVNSSHAERANLHWEGDFVQRAESPTKVWPTPLSYFPYHDEGDMTTVNLYDADVDDDDDDEDDDKSESDTMV